MTNSGLVAVVACLLFVGCGKGAEGGGAGGSSGGGGTGGASGGGGAGPDWAALCPSELTWSPCGELSCATLAVPLDYGNPDGRKVDIHVGATFATEERRGVVLLNFGGPGAAGVAVMTQNLAGLKLLLPDLFRDHDMVTFDPRGVGQSTAMSCGGPIDFARALSSGVDPTDAATWTDLVEQATAVGDACAANGDAELLSRMDSDNVARDMRCLQHALQVPVVDYYGASYGSYLGAKFVSMFPDSVGAVVLDSATGLPTDHAVAVERSAVGYEAALERFAAAVGADASYAFHGGEGTAAVLAAFDATLARKAGVVATASDMGPLGVAAAAADRLRENRWSELSDALADDEAGDPAALRALAGRWFGEAANRTEPTATATWLLDRGCPTGGEAELQAAVVRMTTTAPRFSALWARELLPCLTWPVTRATPAVPVGAPTAPPSLLAVSALDPATPAEHAEELRTALGNSSYVTRYHGEGHGYLLRDACVRGAEAAFLADPSVVPDDCTP